MGKVETKEVPAILDSETMSILRALDPNAKPGADYGAYVRQKLSKRQYAERQNEKLIEGPTDDLEYPGGPARVNTSESIYGQAVSASGAVNAPNVVGGIAPLLALGLPLLPGIIGAIGSVIPKIAGLFRRAPAKPALRPAQTAPQEPSRRRYLPTRERYEEPYEERSEEDEDGSEVGGAVRPPNWGYGGMGDGTASALVGAGERIASALETAKAGPEFWSMLSDGTREELPGILEASGHKIPPRDLPFVLSRLMKRIGLPDSFSKFMRSEVLRRNQRRGSGAGGEGEAGGEGDGEGEGAGDQAERAHARLVRPILKYVAYRATRNPKGAGELYSAMKERLMDENVNPFLQEVKAASGEGAARGDRFAGTRRGPGRSTRSKPRGSRRPMDDDLYGSTGQTAKRVIGSVLSSAAAPGSAALGKVADTALGRLFGKETTLGSDLAKSFGSSILSTVGSELQRSSQRDNTRARREAEERAYERQRWEQEPYPDEYEPRGRAPAPRRAYEERRTAPDYARAPPRYRERERISLEPEPRYAPAASSFARTRPGVSRIPSAPSERSQTRARQEVAPPSQSKQELSEKQKWLESLTPSQRSMIPGGKAKKKGSKRSAKGGMRIRVL